MAWNISLRRSYMKPFPDHIISIVHSVPSKQLLTTFSSGYQAFSILNFTVRFLHLHNSKLPQLLRKPWFGFLSPATLKIHSDMYIRKPFSSKHGQAMAKVTSESNQNKPVALMDSDKCLLFGTADDDTSQLTFAEAKALANKQKCRLVYMHKNSDGVFCFKLQALAVDTNSQMNQATTRDTSTELKPKVKQPKSTGKEFRLQSSISDHDLAIKLSKMQSLLAKGKELTVYINTPASSSKSQKTAATFINKFNESLSDVCNIKEKFRKETATCLVLTPKEKDSSTT